jgi:hypothetical protein
MNPLVDSFLEQTNEAPSVSGLRLGVFGVKS